MEINVGIKPIIIHWPKEKALMENKIKMNPDISYYRSGKIQKESWYLNDSLHRIDAPAVIHYYESSNIQTERWCINGKTHRIDAPAITHYYKSGNIEREYWIINGIRQRIDGPAYIEYSELNLIKEELWYLNGKQLKNNELIEYNEWLTAYNLYKPYNTWTDEEKVLWRLSWV